MLTEEVNRLENDISHSAAKSYWKGDTAEPLKTITIGQLIRNSAEKFADRIAVSMFGGEKLSYYQVDKRVNTTKIGIQKRPVQWRIQGGARGYKAPLH